MKKKEKIIVYIDGFNLYFGMIVNYPEAKWLNVWELANNLLKPTQELIGVKYFTSMVSKAPEKEKRQREYVSAIQTTPVEIIYGHYKTKPKSCHNCGYTWNINEEKMTDVNIAVHMLNDAMLNKFDAAMLISGDSDLVPPINSIHAHYPDKRVLVAFPPNRQNLSVKNAAKGNFIITRQKLMQSQFPDEITLPSSYIISKPPKWK